MLGLGVISPAIAMQAQPTPVCYPYGTPETVNSGVVCPFVAGVSTATMQPTNTATITSTATFSPTSTPIAGEWFVGQEIGVIPDDVGRQGNTIIFVNSWTGDGLTQFPNDVYGTVDLTGKIPPDTKGVFVSGILIITHGTTEEICDLHISFRRDETVPEWTYIGQTIEAQLLGGQRTPMFELLPVKDSKMQIKWSGNTISAGNYPSHCAYGVNFRLAGYVR